LQSNSCPITTPSRNNSLLLLFQSITILTFTIQKTLFMALNSIILTMPIELSGRVDQWTRTFLNEGDIWKQLQAKYKDENLADIYSIDEKNITFENVGGSLYAIVVANKKV